MLANQEIYAGQVATLPDDQWAREIEHWFATQLITIQLYTTEFVTGWQDQWLNSLIEPPKESDIWMCQNQVIQRKDYASFSVLGLGIILAIGGSIMLFNMSITRLVSRLRPRTLAQQYKERSWKANDLLNLSDIVADTIHQRVLSDAVETIDSEEHDEQTEKEVTSVTQKALSVPAKMGV